MQINTIGQNFNSNNRNKVNFTSAVNVKLYGIFSTPDGMKLYKATEDANISEALKALKKMLQGKTNDPFSKQIRMLFSQCFPDEYGCFKNPNIRHYSKGGDSYLFIGNEADAIEDAGKEIGVSKKYYEDALKKSQTDERYIGIAKELEKDFIKARQKYARTLEVVTSPTNSIKRAFKPNQSPEPTELNLYAICPIKNSKNGSKYQINIQGANFAPVGSEPKFKLQDPFNNIIEEITLRTPQKVRPTDSFKDLNKTENISSTKQQKNSQYIQGELFA